MGNLVSGSFISFFINLLQFIADILNPNQTFERTNPLIEGQNIEEDSYAKLFIGYELVFHEVLFNGTAKTKYADSPPHNPPCI